MTARKKIEWSELKNGERVVTTIGSERRNGQVLAVINNASDGLPRYVAELDSVRPDMKRTPVTVRVYLRKALRPHKGAP